MSQHLDWKIQDLPRKDLQKPDPDKYLLSEGLAAALKVAVALNQPLLLTGEPGTGKAFLARHLHDRTGVPGTVTVLETGQCIDDPLAWFERLRAALAIPGTLVLRQIDELPVEFAPRARVHAGLRQSRARTRRPGFHAVRRL